MRDPAVHREVIGKVVDFAVAFPSVCCIWNFPRSRGGGNIEYLLHLRKQEEGQGEVDIRGVVEQAHRDLEQADLWINFLL